MAHTWCSLANEETRFSRSRRAIILIHARSISRLETAFGRCDLVELCNLFFHSSAGVTPGDRRRFDPDSGAGYSFEERVD